MWSMPFARIHRYCTDIMCIELDQGGAAAAANAHLQPDLSLAIDNCQQPHKYDCPGLHAGHERRIFVHLWQVSCWILKQLDISWARRFPSNPLLSHRMEGHFEACVAEFKLCSRQLPQQLASAILARSSWQCNLDNHKQQTGYLQTRPLSS